VDHAACAEAAAGVTARSGKTKSATRARREFRKARKETIQQYEYASWPGNLVSPKRWRGTKRLTVRMPVNLENCRRTI
jgi:hypothetical protein